MTTTFEKYPLGWYANYASRPTIDVEIIANPLMFCVLCDGDATYATTGNTMSEWTHAVKRADVRHRVRLGLICSFCGCADQSQVTFTAGFYYNNVRCARCGGWRGQPIGD